MDIHSGTTRAENLSSRSIFVLELPFINKFPFSRSFLPSPFHSGSPVQLKGFLYLILNILSQQDRPASVKTDAPDVTANDILPQIIYMQQRTHSRMNLLTIYKWCLFQAMHTIPPLLFGVIHTFFVSYTFLNQKGPPHSG